MPKAVLPTSILALALLAANACVSESSYSERSYGDGAPTIAAVVETAPVRSSGDAADDPAIWVHPDTPEKSVILGTDKQAGLYLYNLAGEVIHFLPAGRLNNVDLRQGVTFGEWSGDLAVASNRSDDTITLIAVYTDKAEKIGAIPTDEIEPYGICLGIVADAPMAFVAHKSGNLTAYRLDGPDAGAAVKTVSFDSQLEGCVHDDETGVLYVGEEEAGIWKLATAGGEFSEPQMIDRVGGASGTAADIEGLALYKEPDGGGYLLASSQGNDSYAVYERSGDNAFVGRFRIQGGDIDGAEETDGIEATSAALGASFPEGVFIVQDGFNRPGKDQQNFKIVDWRDVKETLSLD